MSALGPDEFETACRTLVVSLLDARAVHVEHAYELAALSDRYSHCGDSLERLADMLDALADRVHTLIETEDE
jgi:hypothetical protein